MMRSSWTDTAIWVILFLLLVPSGLVVASWNSLPGQRLYQVKIGMEKALLAITPTNQAKGELQVAYTQRRFSEATQLLEDASSPAGLDNFRQQAEEAKRAIAMAPPGAARTQLAQRYIASLQDASLQLEQQKQTIQGHRSAPAQTARQIVVVNQVNQIVVVQQITQTQNVINTIINNVQTISTQSTSQELASPTPTPVPTAIPTPFPTEIPTPVPTSSSLQMSTFVATTDSPTPIPTPIPTNPPDSPTPTWHDNGNGNGNGNGGGN